MNGSANRILIVPAYNEARSIERVVQAIAAVRTGCEVVVVDDGSRDATALLAARSGATVVRHPFNLGYGAALQTGYKYALSRSAEVLVQMDADGQHDPAEVPMLMEPVLSGDLDLVVGSRFLVDSDYEMTRIRRVGRSVFSGVARLAGLRVSDPTSGFQAMNRRVLEVYRADFFPADYPDVDVLLAAYRHGLRVGERPVRMLAANRASTMHGGLQSIYYIYKMMLSTFSSWSLSKREPTAVELSGEQSEEEVPPE
jgi:glycosyltransferase involved in cell wall biosynthesis